MSAKQTAEYVAPPAYVPAVFPESSKADASSLPSISLTVDDVQRDLQWIPQLGLEFREIQ